MSVKKRPDSPFWIIEFKYKGARYRKSSQTKNKREAEEVERKWREDLRRGLVLDEVRELTLTEALDRFFDSHIIYQGPENAAKELRRLNMLRDAFGPTTKLSKITAGVISEYRDSRLSDGRAPATVRRELALLRNMLNKACKEWEVLQAAPHFKMPRVDNERDRFLTSEEEKALLEASPTHLRNFIIFALETGARKSEVLKLQWKDVDLERSPRPIVRFMNTKNKEHRGVPLPKRVSELLRTLKKECPDGEQLVFLREIKKHKKYIPIGDPRTSFENARENANLEDFRIHDLRHTYASRLAMAGVPLLNISKLLGHKDLKMTLRYAHLAPEALDDAVAVLD